MKKHLLLSALVGLVALAFLVVAQLTGLITIAGLAFEHTLGAFLALGLALLLTHDYRTRLPLTRRSVRPAPSDPRFAQSPAILDLTVTLLGTDEGYATTLSR